MKYVLPTKLFVHFLGTVKSSATTLLTVIDCFYVLLKCWALFLDTSIFFNKLLVCLAIITYCWHFN